MKKIVQIIIIILFSFSNIYATNISENIEEDFDYIERMDEQGEKLAEEEINETYSVSTYDNTLDDLIKSLKVQKQESMYNIDLNAPFSKETSGTNENINIETGNLVVEKELLSVTGRNGMDLNLKLIYTIRDAKVYQEEIEKLEDGSLKNAIQEKSKENKAREIFGVGWRLDIPYLEKVDDTMYITLPDRQTYIADSSTVSGMKDYALNDWTFSEFLDEYVGDNCSKYVLTYKNGERYFFKDSGELLEKSNRYGDKIKFVWTVDADGLLVLTKIQDSISRIINIEYHLDNIIIRGEKVNICIKKKQEDEADNKYLLSEIYDNAKRVTKYKYQVKNIKFDLVGKEEKVNKNVLLHSIVYNNDLKTNYSYLLSNKNTTSLGSTEYYRIVRRYEKFDNNIYNYKSYEYTKQPDGYPIYKSKNINKNYSYSTTVTDQKGIKTTYYFNYLHLPTSIVETFEQEKLTEKLIKYEANKMLPIKTILKQYNSVGNFNQSIDEYKYDSFGNILSEQHTGKAMIEYTYDTLYSLLINTKYERDSNTIIEHKNILSSDKKSIVKSILLENGKEFITVDYELDEFGNVVEEKTPIDSKKNRIVKYIFDDNKLNILEKINKGVTDVDGIKEDIVEKYSYDYWGNVTQVTNARGYAKNYKFDSINRLIETTNEDKTRNETHYDDKENVITHINEEGTSIKYYYSPTGKLEKIDIKEHTYLRQKYDIFGNLILKEDAEGNIEEYTYDIQDRTVRIVNKDKNGKLLRDVSILYDEAYEESNEKYLKVTIINQDRKAEYLYDNVGKLVKQTNGKNIQRNFYDNDGNIIKQMMDDEVTEYKYDAQGNVTQIINVDGTITKSVYNKVSQKIFDINELNIITKYDYDEIGRIIKKEEPSTGISYSTYKYLYDGEGNLIEEILPKGNNIKYFYNSRNQLIKTIQDDYITELQYTKLGSIEEVNSNGNIQRYKYNILGQAVEETDTYGNVIKNTYDKMGNLIKTVDKNGVITTNKYDGLNRLIYTENDKDGVGTKIKYNLQGDIIEKMKGNEWIEYKFDKIGNKTKELYSGGIEKKYDYNLKNQLISLNIKHGGSVIYNEEYEYTSRGQVCKLKNGKTIIITKYDDLGRVIEEENNQLDQKSIYNYYPNDKVKQLIYISNNKIRAFYLYEYDENGNVTMKNANGVDEQYMYDNLDRISIVKDDEKLTEYQYDKRGNISSKVESYEGIIKETKYWYDIGNRLTGVQVNSNGNIDLSEYLYDKQGNLIKKSVFEEGLCKTTNYMYNGSNQMNQVILPTQEIVEYKYGIDGFRTSKKIIDVKEILYLYENGNIILEKERNGQEEYLVTNVYQNGIKTRQNDITVLNYIHDAYGNVTKVADVNGVEKEYRYDVFGNEEVSEECNPLINMWKSEIENISNPYRYSSYYYDEETGLYYLKARYYDPQIERFIQEDVFWRGYLRNSESAFVSRQIDNLYVYCLENPIIYSDESGTFIWPGQIHDAVKSYIVTGSPYNTKSLKKYILKSKGDYSELLGRNMLVEVKIKYTDEAAKIINKRYGRADLVDINTGELWDIKPENVNINEAKRQLDGYIMEGNSYEDNFAFIKKKPIPKIGIEIPGGEFEYKVNDLENYKVEYRYREHGILTYRYEYQQPSKEDYTKAIIKTGIVTLLFFVTSGASAVPAYGL